MKGMFFEEEAMQLVKKVFNHKFSKFTLLGVANSVVVWGATIIAAEFFSKWYYPVYFVLSFLVLLTNFLISRKYIFEKEAGFALYAVVYLVFFALNMLGVYYVTLIGVPYWISMVGVTGVLFIVKYFTYDKTVFKGEKA